MKTILFFCLLFLLNLQVIAQLKDFNIENTIEYINNELLESKNSHGDYHKIILTKQGVLKFQKFELVKGKYEVCKNLPPFESETWFIKEFDYADYENPSNACLLNFFNTDKEHVGQKVFSSNSCSEELKKGFNHLIKLAKKNDKFILPKK